MTVECPGCHTRFPVDHRKVPEGGVHARCDVCEDVFFVDVPARVADTGLPFVPAGLTVDDEPEPPEAEVIAEETGLAVEAPEEEAVAELHGLDEAYLESTFEDPESDGPAEEVESAFAAPGWEEEEDPEALFEAPEPVEAFGEEEDEPEPVFEAPEPEGQVEEAETAFPAPGWEEEEVPEPVEVLEEPAPEPPPPFELPAIAAEEPGPFLGESEAEELAEPEVDAPFELPEIVTEERTFGVGTRSFGDGEATFPMDGPSMDAPMEIERESTFGDPLRTIDFSGFTDQVGPPSTEPVPEEVEPLPSLDAPIEVSEEFGTAPTTSEPLPGLQTPPEEPEGVIEETVPPFEPPKPAPPAPDPGGIPPLPSPHFGRRDPKEKAERLARVLVSDIILYNPDRHHRALDQGSLKEEFEDEIQKSWNEYVDQVGDEIANSTNFFNEALNEILAKGQPIF